MDLTVFLIVVAISIVFYFFLKQKQKTSEKNDSKVDGSIPTNNEEGKVKATSIPNPDGKPTKRPQ